MRTLPNRNPTRRKTGGAIPCSDQQDLPDLPTSSEPHRTVKEIAESWKLSEDAVRRIFEREPGVFVLDNPGSPVKRRYRTLRIPKSVEERVHRQFVNAQPIHK
jgi:hypothetical protein